MKKSFLKSCLIFTCILTTTAAMLSGAAWAHNYEEEVQTQQLLSRHWDESELKERFENFIGAIKNREGIEDYIVPDITEEEKEAIRSYFRAFEGKKDVSYVYTKMPVLHRVSGTDEYNDLRGLMELKFRVTEGRKWEEKAKDLAGRFIKNFAKYEGNAAGKALVSAGPKL